MLVLGKQLLLAPLSACQSPLVLEPPNTTCHNVLEAFQGVLLCWRRNMFVMSRVQNRLLLKIWKAINDKVVPSDSIIPESITVVQVGQQMIGRLLKRSVHVASAGLAFTLEQLKMFLLVGWYFNCKRTLLKCTQHFAHTSMIHSLRQCCKTVEFKVWVMTLGQGGRETVGSTILDSGTVIS